MYTSLAANDFRAIFVTSNHFEPGAPRNMRVFPDKWILPEIRNATTGKEYGDIGYQTDSYDVQIFISMLEGHNTISQSYEDLTPSQCTSLYKADFMSSHRNLFLITNYTSSAEHNDTILAPVYVNSTASSSDSWMCGFGLHHYISRCNPNRMASRVASGLPWLKESTQLGEVEAEVSKCRSERVAEKCKVQFSLGIMIAVICCNLVKACCMAMTVARSREPTMVTLGDAIDSFLRIPDPTTMGICFADRLFIERNWRHGFRVGSSRWKRKGIQRWWTSVSKTRWITCNFFCLIAIIITGVLLRMGIGQERSQVSTDIKSL